MRAEWNADSPLEGTRRASKLMVARSVCRRPVGRTNWGMIAHAVKSRRFDKWPRSCFARSALEYALLMDTPVQPSAVAHFTECYQPLVNGVVASIDALRAGLEAAGVDVTIVAPHFPHERDDRAIVRLPSLPLPTPTGYRLCAP